MAVKNKKNNRKKPQVNKPPANKPPENNIPPNNNRPPDFIKDAEPAKATPFTEEEKKIPLGENIPAPPQPPGEQKRGRGRPKGSKNKNTETDENGNPIEPEEEEATKEEQEAARSLMLGFTNGVITALSRIKFQGQQLFTGELITEKEAGTLGKSFLNAYPNIRPNPKLAFWALLGGTIAKRKASNL